MRTLSELTDVDDPAWLQVRKLIAESPVTAEILPPDKATGEATLLQLQVTARSVLGAVTLNTGGLLVDHGWLRVYGGSGTPGLTEVNGLSDGFPQEGLIIGHDVLGGVFTLNGAAPAEYGRPGEPGEVIYFAPDSMAWEPMDGGHSAWMTWLFSGSLNAFYQHLRWPRWEEETTGLSPAHGLSVFPPLWSREARDNLAATSRKPVPMRELIGLHAEFCRQFDDPDPGFLGVVSTPAS